ncbi:MAG: CHAT domain-containing protein [Desulfobacteraceae bacterium]|nr:MAG: CHAT domain-containing protein [Desulfobacteraceae bacterium]
MRSLYNKGLRLIVAFLLVLQTSCAATVKEIPTIAPAREGMVDSRTYTAWYEDRKEYDRLLALLRKEMGAIQLTEANVRLGIRLTEDERATIRDVFERYGSRDPLGDFYRMRQIDPGGSFYDPEGKLYVFDDLAGLHTYGLVDFKKAGEYNGKTKNLHEEIGKRGIMSYPVSDYYNSRRFLYNAFFYRPSGEIPKGFRLVPGRIDLVTPFSDGYLNTVRKLDFKDAGDRIKERESFLAAHLGGKELPLDGQSSPNMVKEPRSFFNAMARFVENLRGYKPVEIHFLLASHAYKAYRFSGDLSLLEEIIRHGEEALRVKHVNSLEDQHRRNLVSFWLGLSFLKRGDKEKGLQFMEKFIAGIDAWEKAVSDDHETKKKILETASREALDQARRDAAWQKAFIVLFVLAGAAGSMAATGGHPQTAAAASSQYQMLQSIGHAASSVIQNMDATLRQMGISAETKAEILRYLSPYALKVNRYLDKHEMVDFFLEMGRAYESKGKKVKALEHYQEAIRIVERQRATIFTERERIAFFSAKGELYDRIILLLVDLSRPGEALEYLERSKSRAFLDLLGSRRIILSDAGENNEYSRMKETTGELDALLGGRDTGAEQVRDLIQKAKRAIAVVSKHDVAPARMMELASLSTVETLKAEEIVRLPGPDEILVEYYLSDKKMIIFLVRDGNIEAVSVPYERQVLKDTVKKWRAAVAARGECMDLSMDLYRRLLAPVEGRLGKRKLIVIPYGVLHYLPFQALHDDRGYLAERFTLSGASSATVMAFVGKDFQKDDRPCLVIGNPTGDLVHAEKEARAISLTRGRSTLLTGPEGTESYVRERGRSYSVIHLATHGRYDEKNPLDSHIVLGADGKNDGRLTSRELFATRLGTSLVTLSACETGLSLNRTGDELIGLQRGLIFAGARSIVSSLWPVDDEATSFLMKSFYRNLDTMDIAGALAEAQRETMASYPHPFYWAAFVLSGASDWRR